MRRMMSREVTKTTIKVAKMEMEDGQPHAVALPDEVVIGNVKLERAQRMVQKEYDEPVTVLQVIPETTTYEMSVQTFIEHATVKEEKQNEEE